MFVVDAVASIVVGVNVVDDVVLDAVVVDALAAVEDAIVDLTILFSEVDDDIVVRYETNESCVVVCFKLVYLVYRSSCVSLARISQLEIDQRSTTPEHAYIGQLNLLATINASLDIPHKLVARLD